MRAEGVLHTSVNSAWRRPSRWCGEAVALDKRRVAARLYSHPSALYVSTGVLWRALRGVGITGGLVKASTSTSRLYFILSRSSPSISTRATPLFQIVWAAAE